MQKQNFVFCYQLCYKTFILNSIFFFLILVCDARKVRATGRGLQQTGVRVKDIADFKIFTENAGAGQLDVKVIGPGM